MTGTDTDLRPRGGPCNVLRLGVLTRDFRVLHELVRRLNARGTTYRVLDFGEPVPPDVGVILTSWRDFTPQASRAQRRIDGSPVRAELPDEVPVIHLRLDESGEEDYDRAISEGLRALTGLGSYRRLVVGIDPGERPGLAFLGDGQVVHTAHLPDVPGVIAHLRRYLPAFPADEVVVRVGHGARLMRNRLINDLLGLSSEEVRVEVVDETATNPQMTRRPSSHLTRDIQAAIGIAMHKGRTVERKMLLDVRPGEVADIQRRSRIESGGAITVDRSLAVRVARGELTMSEALGLQRRRAPSDDEARSGRAACPGDKRSRVSRSSKKGTEKV
jgi:hypothetical protein